MNRLLVMLVFLLLAMEQASAVSLGKNGRGQVLLFPFVTAQNGWDTYLGLNLSLYGGQIVRLRFLDSSDGELVHTFNIYSQPGFNWRAAVFKSQEGPVLRIGEGNCTVSDTGAFGGPGTDFELDASLFMVEAYLVSMTLNDDFSRLPCDALAARWQAQGEWTVGDPNVGLELRGEPETSIVGYFDLVNVAKGLSGTQPATALRDVIEQVPHTSPLSEQPDLSMADPVVVTQNGEVVAYQEWDGIEAVSWAMTNGDNTQVITNDVITRAAIRASTDWLIVYPLRAYGVRGGGRVLIDGEERHCDSTGIRTDGEPSLRWEASRPWGVSGDGTYLYPTFSHFSPGLIFDYVPFLCYSINAVTFGTNAPIFLDDGAENQYRFTELRDVPMTDAVQTVDHLYFYNAGGPRIAFRVTTFINGQVESIPTDPPVYSIANYMTIQPHILRSVR